MKFCPKCQQQYSQTQRFCLIDGELLSLPDQFRLLGHILIEKYRLDALVGIGGMGAVYCAQHLKLGRRVAVKILHPHHVLSNEQIVSLFEREAQVAGQLSHENIATVYDAGQTSDRIVYIAMEWLEGRTLAEALAAGEVFDLHRIADILQQVCAALEAAHTTPSGHIIHRDLKPANIMLVKRADGREWVKVLDFGIAKLSAHAVTDVSLLVGTPLYGSPEQFRLGAQIDRRADIYALGVILFELLTGEVPFRAATHRELIHLHQHGPVPLLRDCRPDAPVALEDLLQRMLAKEPAQRPAQASDVARLFYQALAPFQEAETLRYPKPAKTTLLVNPTPTGPAIEQDKQPTEPINERATAPLAAGTSVWSVVAAVCLGLACVFATVVARRFLSGGLDWLGGAVILILGLFCLAAGLTLTASGRSWVEQGLTRFGLKLVLGKRWQMAGALLALLGCSGAFFALPVVARWYNNQFAVKLQQAGNLPEAISHFERAVSLDPAYAAAHYNLASVYEDVLAFDKAQAEYQAALRLDPKFYFAHNNLARLYLIQQRDYANALKILNAALELKPPEASIKYTLYKNRGWTHLGLELYELALEDLQQALQERADSAAVHCLLAQVLEAQKKTREALPEWEACLAYAPGEADIEASWLSLAQERLRREDRNPTPAPAHPARKDDKGGSP